MKFEEMVVGAGAAVALLQVAVKALDAIAFWSCADTHSLEDAFSANMAREALRRIRGGDGRPKMGAP
jgi:hypothetical protein